MVIDLPLSPDGSSFFGALASQFIEMNASTVKKAPGASFRGETSAVGICTAFKFVCSESCKLQKNETSGSFERSDDSKNFLIDVMPRASLWYLHNQRTSFCFVM